MVGLKESVKKSEILRVNCLICVKCISLIEKISFDFFSLQVLSFYGRIKKKKKKRKKTSWIREEY